MRESGISKRLSVQIFCPSPVGGIAEHAHYQAKALADLGVEVTMLASPSYLGRRSVDYPVLHCLAEDEAPSSTPSWTSRAFKAWRRISNEWRFAWEIAQRKPTLAFYASYAEYLAPFWILPHLVLAWTRGQIYGANLHDPVRDYQVGPAWWHRLSIALAYLPLRFGLVHQRIPSPSPIPKHVHVLEAPVGLYEFSAPSTDTDTLRKQWQVPPGKKVFLAFGFIRDNKNLDLAVTALANHPDAFLVVAGKAQSTKDKPLEFYRKLAREKGVVDRAQFFDVFVPDEELSAYFAAADFILLTYGASFHSQSGVLNLAARVRKPVLASAGPSPMEDAVKQFGLGAFVQPDSGPALSEGMGALLRSQVAEPRWEEYEAYASWKTNVNVLLDQIVPNETQRLAKKI